MGVERRGEQQRIDLREQLPERPRAPRARSQDRRHERRHGEHAGQQQRQRQRARTAHEREAERQPQVGERRAVDRRERT